MLAGGAVTLVPLERVNLRVASHSSERFGPGILVACSLHPANTCGLALTSSCSVATTLDMTVAAISWDVSTVTNSSGASDKSQTCHYGSLSALDALPPIKVPRRDCTPRAASRITLSRGPQTALKTFLSGPMDDLWRASHRDMGRERCEGHCMTGPSAAVLADDSLLTIKTPLRTVRSSGVAWMITRLPTIPQLAVRWDTGSIVKPLIGSVSLVVDAVACRRRVRPCLCDGCSDAYGLGLGPTISHYGHFQNANADVVTRDIGRMQ
ncbi:hypothetical protein MTO96_012759 [Rhipicephalus appendiculatus]